MLGAIRTIAVLLVATAAFAPASWGQAAGAAGSEAAIRKVLQSQVDAWNRDDLGGFMAGYWNSPELTFFSGASETKGWQPTLDHYRKNYQSPGAEMGKLEMENVRVEMLSPTAAFVRGKFLLALSNGKRPHGLFTLIFREFPDGWRIVHDHSSGE
jgi:beta-aspartyl-peptidase (threonine type)